MDKKFWAMMVLTLGLVLVLSTTIQAHEPDVKSVDYAHPKKYLEILPSFGNNAAIRENANKLKGQNDLDTIENVLDWMEKNLKYNSSKGVMLRNYDDVVKEGEWGSCADFAVVCGALLRGAGIPVIWVKTLDVSFIWAFRNSGSLEWVSGHVFLEVYVDKNWALLDANTRNLYQKNYDPGMRILPGNRFAFDKGNDLYEMITSFTMEEYRQQIKHFLPKVAKALLPVDEKSSNFVGQQVYVIGDSPFYEIIGKMAAEYGLHVAASFNTDYDKYLPKARGHVLLIETHRGKPIVPAEILEKYFTNVLTGMAQAKKSIRIDDTIIVFMDFAQMQEQLQGISKFGQHEKKGSANNPDASDRN